MATKKERIAEKAFELLEATSHDIQFSELVAQLHTAFPDDPHGTITGSIWNLDARFPELIYKPSRGLFRLVKFREDVVAQTQQMVQPTQGTPCESEFYVPFADYTFVN